MKIKESYKEYGIDLQSNDINLKLDSYVNEDGIFDYESYVREQTKVNIKKLDFSGPDFWKISRISDHIKQNIPDYKFGICHGTRRGTEQKDFRNILGIDVIGTEISETAEQFPNTIQWDFHEVKEEWKDNTCFIFSNSLDHSYDPIKCLRAWMSCIKPGGLIYIQRGPDDRPESMTGDTPAYPDADVFQSTEEIFTKMVDIAGDDVWEIARPDRLVFRGGDLKSMKSVIVLRRK